LTMAHNIITFRSSSVLTVIQPIEGASLFLRL
jgi:hypothetical protein